MSQLSQIILSRLVEDTQISAWGMNFVESSLVSIEALQAVDQGREEAQIARDFDENDEPLAGVFLKSLDVTGFRGIARTTTLTLDACPGWTLIVGRNGSGKSSLAEAFEVVLTGKSSRYEGKNKGWLKGWKNIHFTGRPWVRGHFAIESSPSLFLVKRSWNDEAKADFYTFTTKECENNAVSLRGWESAIETFRPILSYNEFASTLDKGPSHLYDFVRKVLGLEEITLAKGRLDEVAKTLKLADKTRKETLKNLETALQDSTDERSLRAKTFLSGRKKNIEGLTGLCLIEAIEDSHIALLRKVATLKIPDLESLLEVTELFRECDRLEKEVAILGQTQEGKVFTILQQAVDLDFAEDADCPLCKTSNALTAQWRKKALEVLDQRAEIKKAKELADKRKEEANRKGEHLLALVPLIPDGCVLASADAAHRAREHWRQAPQDYLLRADHFEKYFDELLSKYRTLKSEAENELKILNAEWIPIQQKIVGFLDADANAEKTKPKMKALKEASDWLKRIDVDLREERLAPIREQTQKIWTQLAHRSNVKLEGLRLEGNNNSRKLNIDVSVDGKEATALGVMSQGELHALLLSLFLPRLTSEQSPFKFLIIDDPVQAMDPAKVDGLARVLAEVAKTRQVVVFTHDARLPAAVRRMEIPTRIIEVSRGEKSIVELCDKQNRAKQFLDDARLVEKDRNKYGPRVAQNVVPGLCRAAIESYFQIRVWEKLLSEGVVHADIEMRLDAIKEKGVQKIAALALLGDAGKGSEVYKYLENKSPGAVDVFKALKSTHGGYKGEVKILIQKTTGLLRDLGASV